MCHQPHTTSQLSLSLCVYCQMIILSQNLSTETVSPSYRSTSQSYVQHDVNIFIALVSVWNTFQQALLYISVQEKLPGLPTQRSKCEVWPDQTFFHFWVYKQTESVCQIVWLGLSSVRHMSESVAMLLSDVATPSSRALIVSSKVRPLVWYTWKHGHAQRNLLHGPQRNLVLRPLGFL